MKKILSIFLITHALLMTGAYAGGTRNLLNMDCGSCTTSPSSAGFTFAEAEQAFKAAKMATAISQWDNWILVGMVGINSKFIPAIYNLSGVGTSDYGIDGLKFQPKGIDFFGNESYSVSFVSFTPKVVTRHQGPYDVSMLPSVGSACFAEYGTLRDGRATRSYYNYECREIADNKLLCAVKLMVHPDESDYVEYRYKMQFDGIVAGYKAYQLY